MNEESAIEFPCEFPIKMMGRDSPEFRITARALIENHVGPVAEEAIYVNLSGKGNFVSVTSTWTAAGCPTTALKRRSGGGHGYGQKPAKRFLRSSRSVGGHYSGRTRFSRRDTVEVGIISSLHVCINSSSNFIQSFHDYYSI